MISTIHVIDTIYSADSVEWCPHNTDVFACGTYQLEQSTTEETQFDSKCKRKGRIYVIKFNTSDETMDRICQLETNAILDQKWHPKENILSTADSKGFIHLYQYENLNLSLLSDTNIGQNDELLALSLDWNKTGDKLVVSDSKGNFNILSVSDSNLTLHQQHNAHGFEAWISIFDHSNDNLIYTGGDDTFLNCYDIRLDSSSPTLRWKNKSHGAGVTSILSPSNLPNFIVTGSYDEILRIFDIRSPKSSLFEINLGGGIWRIKQHPFNQHLLLTANMYHNFSVVEINQRDNNLHKLAEYFEHKSICYGADWCPTNGPNIYLATCSFYDHKLCISKYNMI